MTTPASVSGQHDGRNGSFGSGKPARHRGRSRDCWVSLAVGAPTYAGLGQAAHQTGLWGRQGRSRSPPFSFMTAGGRACPPRSLCGRRKQAAVTAPCSPSRVCGDARPPTHAHNPMSVSTQTHERQPRGRCCPWRVSNAPPPPALGLRQGCATHQRRHRNTSLETVPKACSGNTSRCCCAWRTCPRAQRRQSSRGAGTVVEATGGHARSTEATERSRVCQCCQAI